jgi:regulator of protease activity HflC (stomatin/prohibitin superfamily)
MTVGGDDTLYRGGTHFLGVGQSFVVFPTAQQSVRFQGSEAISARTLNGLNLFLEVSFNFRLGLSITDLTNLYYSYGEFEEVSTLYNRIARNVVRTVSSEYDAFSFFFNRTLVEARMNVDLASQLDEVNGILDSFQLLDVRLPTRFSDARVRQLNAVQEKEAAANEKRVAEIGAATRINQTNIEVSSILINAEKEAEQKRIAAGADINKLVSRLAAEASGFEQIKTQLGLDSQRMLGYVYVDALQEARKEGKVVKMRVPTGTFKPFEA